MQRFFKPTFCKSDFVYLRIHIYIYCQYLHNIKLFSFDPLFILDLKSPCSNYIPVLLCKVMPLFRIVLYIKKIYIVILNKYLETSKFHLSIVKSSKVKAHFEMNGIILILKYVLNNNCTGAKAGNSFHCCYNT